MSAEVRLQPETVCCWRAGFGNLVANEMRLWWGTSRWWIQALIWLVVVNGVMALMAFSAEQIPDTEVGELPEMLAQLMTGFMAYGVSIGAIIGMQGAIIGEREHGTAEWVLSKPVSRTAFVLSKLIGGGVGYLATGVLLQAAIAYGQMGLWTGAYPDPVRFLGGVGMVALHVLFYVALTLWLGTAFRSRGAVLGGSLGLLLGGGMIGSFLAMVLPLKTSEIAAVWILGEALPWQLLLPVPLTALWIVVLVAAAIRRFEREEL